MSLWAIGDIHGCYRTLMDLMEIIQPTAEDTLVFLGDYMDRGPRSKEVVEQLISWHKLYPHWKFLYGNHEDIFEDWYNGCRKYGPYNWFANGGNKTYVSYQAYKPTKRVIDEEERLQSVLAPANFPQEHLDFLFKETQYFYETDEFFFVHAGVRPNLSLEENKHLLNDITWIREEFIESNYDWGKTIVFGHTADYEGRYNGGNRFEPIIMANKIGLDTAVCPPACNKLTAMNMDTRTIVQVDYNE